MAIGRLRTEAIEDALTRLADENPNAARLLTEYDVNTVKRTLSQWIALRDDQVDQLSNQVDYLSWWKETHALTASATLDRLRALYPRGRFEVRRFRPNIIVETAAGGEDFAENAWIGKTLAIGDAVTLSITGPCPRCVMTTLPQGDLPHDAGVLRTAVQNNGGNVGVYASVLRGGKVRRGDSVRLE